MLTFRLYSLASSLLEALGEARTGPEFRLHFSSVPYLKTMTRYVCITAPREPPREL